ncbi:MAG: hypothetical protein LBC92_00845 [Rickettsiales bacterium]|jgi:hypothetical protein|nr:hypothetical protein [Rickettsiales bacterium]
MTDVTTFKEIENIAKKIIEGRENLIKAIRDGPQGRRFHKDSSIKPVSSNTQKIKDIIKQNKESSFEFLNQLSAFIDKKDAESVISDGNTEKLFNYIDGESGISEKDKTSLKKILLEAISPQESNNKYDKNIVKVLEKIMEDSIKKRDELCNIISKDIKNKNDEENLELCEAQFTNLHTRFFALFGLLTGLNEEEIESNERVDDAIHNLSISGKEKKSLIKIKKQLLNPFLDKKGVKNIEAVIDLFIKEKENLTKAILDRNQFVNVNNIVKKIIYLKEKQLFRLMSLLTGKDYIEYHVDENGKKTEEYYYIDKNGNKTDERGMISRIESLIDNVGVDKNTKDSLKVKVKKILAPTLDKDGFSKIKKVSELIETERKRAVNCAKSGRDIDGLKTIANNIVNLTGKYFSFLVENLTGISRYELKNTDEDELIKKIENATCEKEKDTISKEIISILEDKIVGPELTSESISVMKDIYANLIQKKNELLKEQFIANLEGDLKDKTQSIDRIKGTIETEKEKLSFLLKALVNIKKGDGLKESDISEECFAYKEEEENWFIDTVNEALGIGNNGESIYNSEVEMMNSILGNVKSIKGNLTKIKELKNTITSEELKTEGKNDEIITNSYKEIEEIIDSINELKNEVFEEQMKSFDNEDIKKYLKESTDKAVKEVVSEDLLFKIKEVKKIKTSGPTPTTENKKVELIDYLKLGISVIDGIDEDNIGELKAIDPNVATIKTTQADIVKSLGNALFENNNTIEDLVESLGEERINDTDDTTDLLKDRLGHELTILSERISELISIVNNTDDVITKDKKSAQQELKILFKMMGIIFSSDDKKVLEEGENKDKNDKILSIINKFKAEGAEEITIESINNILSIPTVDVTLSPPPSEPSSSELPPEETPETSSPETPETSSSKPEAPLPTSSFPPPPKEEPTTLSPKDHVLLYVGSIDKLEKEETTVPSSVLLPTGTSSLPTTRTTTSTTPKVAGNILYTEKQKEIMKLQLMVDDIFTSAESPIPLDKNDTATTYKITRIRGESDKIYKKIEELKNTRTSLRDNEQLKQLLEIVSISNVKASDKSKSALTIMKDIEDIYKKQEEVSKKIADTKGGIDLLNARKEMVEILNEKDNKIKECFEKHGIGTFTTYQVKDKSTGTFKSTGILLTNGLSDNEKELMNFHDKEIKNAKLKQKLEAEEQKKLEEEKQKASEKELEQTTKKLREIRTKTKELKTQMKSIEKTLERLKALLALNKESSISRKYKTIKEEYIPTIPTRKMPPKVNYLFKGEGYNGTSTPRRKYKKVSLKKEYTPTIPPIKISPKVNPLLPTPPSTPRAQFNKIKVELHDKAKDGSYYDSDYIRNIRVGNLSMECDSANGSHNWRRLEGLDKSISRERVKFVLEINSLDTPSSDFGRTHAR